MTSETTIVEENQELKKRLYEISVNATKQIEWLQQEMLKRQQLEKKIRDKINEMQKWKIAEPKFTQENNIDLLIFHLQQLLGDKT